MENLLSSDADSVHGFPKSIGAYSPLGSGFAYIFLWPIVKFFLNFLPFNTDGAQEGYVALVAGCQCILPYLFRHAWEFFTCSIIIFNEQGDVNDVRKWITEHGAGAGQNHVNLQLGRTEVQNGSADLLHEVEKYSAARPTYFQFDRHLMHLERLDKLPDDNRPRMWGPFHPPGTSPGDTVRISTSKGGKNRLEDFVQSVMKAKRAKVRTITTYSVQEFNDCGTKRLYWVRRAVPSRSMNTIDLDQSVKTELIQDFETFVDPNRADWYIERGIPYYRGYLLHGPPGTGKSSTAFTLACLRDKCLYTLSLKEVHSQSELRQLFGAPCKGDVLLLEDIDTAGIRREDMQAETF